MANRLSEATRSAVLEQIPDYQRMLAEDARLAIIRVIAQDFYFFAERNLSIEDKQTSDILPLIDVMNWQQKRLVELVLQDIADGRPVRYIILKARQMGLSTIIEALCYWWTTTHRNIHSLIIAHESIAADNLYNMFKRYFDYSHSDFQPTRKYNNKKELVFDVDDRIKEEWQQHISNCREPETCGVSHKPRGLGSSIKTMVAKPGKGRSLKIHFFHGSEVAFWEGSADVASAAMQAVPLAPFTFVFLESTANGVGGYYYDTWQNAKIGKSNLRAIFFAWHEHEEYELPGTCNNIYDDEEVELLEIFAEKGYEVERFDRKILWRREKKKEFLDDPKKFYQEYPKDDIEAFIASGRPRFDTKMLMKWDNYARQNPLHRFGQVVPNANPDSLERYSFEEVAQVIEGQDPTPLKIWEEPLKRKHGVNDSFTAKYVIGVDVSEGKLNTDSQKKESDYSVIDVTRVDNLKTVARWRGHIDPDLIGGVAYAIGMFYNKALIGVEVNNHGLTTVQSLKNKSYPNMYTRKTSEEQRFQERTSLMGWQTNRKTKKIIIDNLAQAIRENDIIDLDVVFIQECMTYIRADDGTTNAQEGRFDDTVMAKAIALKLTDYQSVDTKDLREKINKPAKRITHEPNGQSALNAIANTTSGASSNSSRRAATISRRRAARAARKSRR